MRLTICLIAALALVPAAAPASAKTAKPAAFEIDHTSWTMTSKKDGRLRESIAADGTYVTEVRGGKQVDHGTAMMKDGKACFASALKNGDHSCWTTRPVAIGHSMVTTSDKGQKIRVTRVAYMPMKAK